MRLERHLFGSIRGYETLASSAGVSGDESSELSELGFGQSSDPGFLASLNNQICALGRPLRSGRIAITRVFQGPPDDAGRPTLHLRTLVASASDFQRLRSGIESLLHDAAAWDSAAFDSGRAFDWNGRGSSIRASEDVWRLADWAMELQGRRDVVLRVPEDARGEAAVLGLIASVADEDAIRLRWGLRLLSSSAAADVCTMLSAAALSPRRRIVDVPLDGAWRHAALGDARYRAQGMRTFEYMRSVPTQGEGYGLDPVAGGRPPVRRATAPSMSSVVDPPSRGRGRSVLAAAAILLMIIGGTIVMTWPREVGTIPDSIPPSSVVAQSEQTTLVPGSNLAESVGRDALAKSAPSATPNPDFVGDIAQGAGSTSEEGLPERQRIDPQGGPAASSDGMLGTTSSRGSSNQSITREDGDGGESSALSIGDASPRKSNGAGSDPITEQLETSSQPPPRRPRSPDEDAAGGVRVWDGDTARGFSEIKDKLDAVIQVMVALNKAVSDVDPSFGAATQNQRESPTPVDNSGRWRSKAKDLGSQIEILKGKLSDSKISSKLEDLATVLETSGVDLEDRRWHSDWFLPAELLESASGVSFSDSEANGVASGGELHLTKEQVESLQSVSRRGKELLGLLRKLHVQINQFESRIRGSVSPEEGGGGEGGEKSQETIDAKVQAFLEVGIGYGNSDPALTGSWSEIQADLSRILGEFGDRKLDASRINEIEVSGVPEDVRASLFLKKDLEESQRSNPASVWRLWDRLSARQSDVRGEDEATREVDSVEESGNEQGRIDNEDDE